MVTVLACSSGKEILVPKGNVRFNAVTGISVDMLFEGACHEVTAGQVEADCNEKDLTLKIPQNADRTRQCQQ